MCFIVMNMRLSALIYNNGATCLSVLSNSNPVLLPVVNDLPQIVPIPLHVFGMPLSPERITLMNFNFSTRFTGTLAAAAIAATTFSAAPAFADRNDDRATRAIATLLGLVVVGKIIHDNNKDRPSGHVTVRKLGHDVGNGRVSPRPRPLPSRVGRATLPRKCFRRFQTRRGQVNMFVRRCLERNFRAVNRLPQACAQRVRTDRGPRFGFGARCLRRNGYRVSRR